MAFIAQTAFLPRIWNNRNDDIQNFAGKFVDGSNAAADCSAGYFVVKGDHMVGGGYKFTQAADGKGDVYICNPGDVQRLSNGENLWAVGKNTLGLGIPAGVMGTFSKAKPGETYAFGYGNFSTLVDATTNVYATIDDGLLVGTNAAPEAGSGIYFKLDAALGIDVWTEGDTVAFDRYNMLCLEA